MSAQNPLITARLVALLPALAGWSAFTVVDGPISSGDMPANFCTVGFNSDGQSGSYTVTQDASGFQWDESGTVHGEIVAATGSIDLNQPGDRGALLAARSLVQAALDSIDAAVRADRRLGVLPPESSLTFTVTATPQLNSTGAAYIARWALAYTTVT